MTSHARKPTVRRVRDWEPGSTVPPRPITRIAHEKDDADLQPTKRLVLAPGAMSALAADDDEAAPMYRSGIQDLLGGPEGSVHKKDAVTQENPAVRAPSKSLDAPALSALVAVYAERVERRSTWLHAEFTPALKRERPIRHVLGPRPLLVVVASWLAFALPFLEAFAGALGRLVRRGARFASTPRLHSLRSIVERSLRDDPRLKQRIALVVVVAAVSSLMTLLATRL